MAVLVRQVHKFCSSSQLNFLQEIQNNPPNGTRFLDVWFFCDMHPHTRNIGSLSQFPLFNFQYVFKFQLSVRVSLREPCLWAAGSIS